MNSHEILLILAFFATVWCLHRSSGATVSR